MLAFNKITQMTQREEAISIAMVFIEIFAGVLAGGIFGLLAIPFKYIKNEASALYAKGVFGIVMCILITALADGVHFGNGMFICALIFGYVCQQVWGS